MQEGLVMARLWDRHGGDDLKLIGNSYDGGMDGETRTVEVIQR